MGQVIAFVIIQWMPLVFNYHGYPYLVVVSKWAQGANLSYKPVIVIYSWTVVPVEIQYYV